MKKKQLTYHNESGFKVPKNYFENFEGHLFSKLNENKVLDKKLDTGFEVPENYFEKFELDLPKEKETRVIALFSRRQLKFAASIAAMLVFMLSIFNDYGTKKISFSTIGYETVEAYLENDNVDFNNLEIERIISKDYQSAELKFNKIGEDALFDYLMNTSTELSLTDY